MVKILIAILLIGLTGSPELATFFIFVGAANILVYVLGLEKRR